MGPLTLIMQALASPPAASSKGGCVPQRALVAVGPDPSTVLSCAPKIKLSQFIDQGRDVEVPLWMQKR